MENTPETPLKQVFIIGDNEYVYNFDEMSTDRIFDAQTFFRLDEQMRDKFPAFPSEINIAAERQTLRHAFAPLLMKVTAQGYEKYNPATTSGYDILSEIKGKDLMRLEGIKQDFFDNSGLASEFLTLASKRQQKEMIAMLKGFDPEQIISIVKMLSTLDTSLLTKPDGNSISMDTINANIESLITGQSSGSQPETTQSKGKKS